MRTMMMMMILKKSVGSFVANLLASLGTIRCGGQIMSDDGKSWRNFNHHTLSNTCLLNSNQASNQVSRVDEARDG